MNERQVSVHLQSIAEDAVPATTDLWPAIAAEAEAARPLAARRTARRRLLPLVAAVMVLAALGLATVAPAAEAADRVADRVLTIIGIRGTATAVGSPVCVRGDEQAQPILQPVEAPTPPGGAPPGAVAAMKVSCPEGFELKPPGDQK